MRSSIQHRAFGERLHTSKDGAELLPAGDATLRGELTQGDLQEEDRQTSAKQENEVGDEKCTWVEGRRGGATAGEVNRWTEREDDIDNIISKRM